MIEFKNVSKKYGTGTVAVDNANFTIEKGEFAFLIGDSGSGKSTMIKMMLKEEDPTSGNIIINGRDITKIKPSKVPYLRRSMGIVFQDFRLLPDKTVYDNVAFAMYVVRASQKHIKRQVPMVLSLVGLSQKAKMYPNELSGGEQQRVALARAIVNNPSMLIADEPTGNLDPNTAWDIMELLNDINLRGTTVVVATHAKDIVDRMNRRVIRIDHGNIVRDEKGGYDKQKKMTSASIIIMVATMVMFGLFFVISQNVNYIATQLENQQAIKVNLKDGLTQDEINNLQVQIEQISGVNKPVQYKSKADALITVRTQLGDKQDLLAGWDGENNPFPASFIVRLTDLKLNKSVQDAISKLDGISDINSNNDLLSNLDRVANALKIVTGVLMSLLVLISVFIISYTIKLTVHARRKEISIMKYVGATNGFIRGPFIVEGVMIGIISAIITLSLMSGIYNAMINGILDSSVLRTSQIELYRYGQIFFKLLVAYLMLGIGIGALGSVISMKKYLDV